MVPWRKILLHKTGRKATKTVWWRWGLTERRWLLVWRERPSEVWRSLLKKCTATILYLSDATNILHILALNNYFLLFL